MDTTTTTLRWALLYMLHYPLVQDRLRKEIRREIGDREVTMDDKTQLHYAQVII